MPARIKALPAAIVLTGLAGSLFVTSSALAVTLGEISLTSTLNEPLNAVIELADLGGLDASEIVIAVADQAAYDQVDMERTPFLDDIQFTIEVDSTEAGRVILSSIESVTEPFLNLIITASEPEGSATLKEYTLLVDLPSSSTQAPVQVAPAVAGQPAAEAPVASNSEAAAYTVGVGETLWEIAASKRPDGSVSVQQMMVAIQRANPDAFIGGNINRLVSGRVLRMPSAQDIQIIDQDSAIAQVTQQNSDLGGQPLAGGTTGAGATPAATRDQLSVLSGDDVDGGGGSSDLAATIAALEEQVMLSEENLDRARIENLELNNRLAALQEQIDLLENIIAIEDERIAQLQSELATQAEATAQALASADTAATAISDIQASESESGLTGMLKNTAVVLGGVLVLVLLFLGVLVQRRKQAQAAVEANIFNPALVDEDPTVPVEEKPGLLAGLLARFRRNRDADDDDYEADVLVTNERIEPVAVAALQPRKNSTDSLLDDMGITEDMMNLDDALDRVAPEQTGGAVEVFEPHEDELPAVVKTARAEESSAEAQDADFAMAAATDAFAMLDEEPAEPAVTDFNTTLFDEPINVPEESIDADAEIFEFTLKDIPDVAEVETAAPAVADADKIETFEFKLSTRAVESPPAVEPVATATASRADALEVVAFPGTMSAAKDRADDDMLDLGDLSFDDTMVTDDGDEDGACKPRTGNECDTKLDLATAYEAMGDVTEAIEILDEVIAEGNPAQIETAQRLKQTWQSG
ncbi:MAG: hypothetical protein RLZZ227_2536 [Pseudomonadota bacterium]|jgi:pilus assembly protein FimV